MTAPFAALEARVNTAIDTHLSNAVATIGAAEVAGLLDVEPVDAFDRVAGNRTVFECAAASAATLSAGNSIVIGSASYTIKQIEVERGRARLHLKDAP